MQILQRLHHRGRQVRAAPDGFPEQDIQLIVTDELLHRTDQVRELATKAAAADLFDRQASFFEEGGVDEVIGLVVCDQANTLALGGESLRDRRQQSRLAGARKPPTRITDGLLISTPPDGCKFKRVNFGSTTREFAWDASIIPVQQRSCHHQRGLDL